MLQRLSSLPRASRVPCGSRKCDSGDLMLDDNDPSSTAAPAAINVVPVTDRTNQFLNGAFTNKMTGTECCTLRSAYTLPQNELTRALFLDTMMGLQCLRMVKSTDRSLYTIKGLLLEAIGLLSQLLEAVNDPNPQVSMDQIGEAVETAVTLLANASNKMSLMRRTRILDEYNKELVPFAAAKERDWASAAPRLFGPNFLKEATDYLQQLQLVWKVKEKPAPVFRQPPVKPAGGPEEDHSPTDINPTLVRPTPRSHTH